MSLWSSPPTATKASFRRGDTHLGVYSLQTLLNGVYAGKLTPITPDGAFGPATELAVKRYQADVGILSDGIVGPKTQERMVRSCIVRAGIAGQQLPKGLLEGQVNLESGGYIAAVNAKVPGGVDYGFTQRRVYGPPFDEVKVRAAASPLVQIALSANELVRLRTKYSTRHPACPFNAWELAVLHHNWPWAADTYASFGSLGSAASKPATWVTWAAMTYDQWAHTYVELVTRDVDW